MTISLGILFGIIAMLGWGIADFFVANAVRRSKVTQALLWINTISFSILFIVFLLFFRLPALPIGTIAFLLITSLVAFISIMAFYKGLQVGNVSVVSPVSASATVITVILSILILKESINSLQAAAIAITICGAVLASFKLHDLMKLRLKNFSKGVEYALIAMFGWGILFILIDRLVDELGWFFPFFFLIMIELFYILAYSAFAKKALSFPKNAAVFIVLSSVFETTAFLSFGFGISMENIAVVSPIAFAFPAVTIILARIFFKEILDLNQKIGIAAVLLGLVLLAI